MNSAIVSPSMMSGGALIGLLTGILVGLSGIGGGLLLLPLLISVLGVPPVVAVGSAAAISCITKIGAGSVHWYQRNVRWPLVLRLASGSIPGAVAGVVVLTKIQVAYGSAVNDFLRVAIGVLLVVVPIVYLAGQYFWIANAPHDAQTRNRNQFGITIIGFLGGFLVGVTSIGAGSVILLLLLFCGLPPAAMVGTDVVHGVLLAGVTAVLQLKLLRNVDFLLVASVLAGSLPGSVLGVYFARHIPSVALKRILCTLLAGAGAGMIWEVLQHAN